MVQQTKFERDLSDALRETEREAEKKEIVKEIVETETQPTVVSKVPTPPYKPTQAEIDLHEAQGHTPYRNWCASCVAGLCPDARHEKQTDPETGNEVPVIEFDYAKSIGKATDPESPIPFISASESIHNSAFASYIKKKGSGDEYVMSAFLNWIKTL